MNVAALPEEAQKYINTLEKKNRELEKSYDFLNNAWEEKYSVLNTSWEERYISLEEQYKLLLLHRFGRKSEKEIIDPNQKLLFGEESETENKEETETITYTRKKPGRGPIDESLPREETILDIPEEEKQCACGHEMVRIGEEVAEKLHIIRPKMWVEKIIRPKYACTFCEGSGDEGRPAVRIADVPESIIPKSIVTPGLLSFIIENKFVDHLPYYRQEKRFERIGIRISRQNMSNWQISAYEKIKPIIELFKESIRGGPVIYMDETPVQVLNEPGRENARKSYMWLTRGGPPDKPVLLYTYKETRGSEHINELTKGFKGYLQTDGYRAYDTALEGNNDIIHVGCMAHVRRKFIEAGRLSKKAGSAQEALTFIRKLYVIEDKLRNKELLEEEFIIVRRQQAEPVLEEFKGWLLKRKMQVPPSLKLGKAIEYALHEWPKLIRYLECSHLTPDNNISERAIRPFVVGRKNWLFGGSPSGMTSSCGMYSLIETAKHNGLNPNDYLIKVFEDAPRIKNPDQWDTLLPWNISNNGRKLLYS